MIDSFFLIIAFVVLVICSYTDIKTREIPDWINYGLIAVGFGTRLIFSAALSDWAFILDGLLGFACFFILAYIMFYSGQWGGGDAKLIMGLGALFGLNFDLSHFSVSFIINSFIIGAFFALIYSAFLIITNWNKFKKEIVRYRHSKVFMKLRILAFLLFIVGVLLFFIIDNVIIKFYSISILFLIILMIYFWVVIKAVEKSGMLKLVEPSKLTEGDWIAEEIRVNGRLIAGPKDLGIEMKQIKKLIELRKKKKIGKILIKEGMPFVPSFLASFVFTYFFGNIVSILLEGFL